MGTTYATVEATNHQMAAIKAIEEYQPDALGLLVAILKEGDSFDDEIFIKSEYLLDCMGYKIINAQPK
jgi:hypothetical protein